MNKIPKNKYLCIGKILDSFISFKAIKYLIIYPHNTALKNRPKFKKKILKRRTRIKILEIFIAEGHREIKVVRNRFQISERPQCGECGEFQE